MKKRICSLLLALVILFGLLPVTAWADSQSNSLEYMIFEDHVEITGYSGNAETVVIPTRISRLPVTSINDWAFYGCDTLTSISIPDSVTNIGDYAFYYCSNLESISIPNGVTFIGNYTFGNCINLFSVSIPDSVTSIGNYAFDYCYRLTNISIPDSVTSIGENAFSDCHSLTSISIPDGVTSIGKSTFYNCHSLTSVSIPDRVTSIGENAFSVCSSLTSIFIPNSVTSIGIWAFASCESLISISIPDGVTSIGYGTFSGCKNLCSISIPDSIAFISDYAFNGCQNLASIYFEGDAPEFGNSVFKEVTADAYFPSGNRTWTVMQSYGGSISWIPYIAPFYDVLASSFYADPVTWAMENGITAGTSPTTFTPNGSCLRAQVVTFLHRAAENPAPSSINNPFSDVITADYFYNPVLWAVEEGITQGTSATTFGSYDVCNRAAVVTFLWRAAGEPEPASTSNPFVDVTDADYFYKPILWAVENGITSGVDATHFAPASPCNRAQVVTFLYRAYN